MTLPQSVFGRINIFPLSIPDADCLMIRIVNSVPMGARTPSD